MLFMGMQAELTNWTKSANSTCLFLPVNNVGDIVYALETARAQHLSVIPHGAGHSYTDAALNTGEMVLDLKPMHRILSWDPSLGIMSVEPGVTLLEMIQMAWKDGWWPATSPSTPEVTVGGSAAMNVNGRNAWKCGPFGAHILSLEMMLASGELSTLSPERDKQLFHAVIGSMGLLGIITSITVQLQSITSGMVSIRRRPAASLAEIFTLFSDEEENSDYLEAWVDGFASGEQLGRGNLTSALMNYEGDLARPRFSSPAAPGRMETQLIHMAAKLGRPVITPGVQMANRVSYWATLQNHGKVSMQALFPYSFWPPAAFTAYHAFFLYGVETFQVFVPGRYAKEIFEQVLRYSQRQGFSSLWTIIKRHRRDPFLLSYQVDGFSIELNYQRTRDNAQRLRKMIEQMIAIAIEGGGRFYMAKDHYLTHDQYCRSMGNETIDTFLRIKQQLDPEMRLQSDLFRRLFR